MADQGAGVEIGDDGYVCTGEERVGGGIAAPIAGHGRELADHQAFNVGTPGLVVGGAGSVIADLGIGEDDDLAGIRRVGEDFLVSGDRRVKDDFARTFDGRTKTLALEDRAVFQGEDCWVQLGLILQDLDNFQFSR